MASFVSTMHELRRMCRAIQSENQKSPSGSWCRNCPIEQFCVIDTEIKYSTDDAFRTIDERVQAWADKNKEPVYPTWWEYLTRIHVIFPVMGDFQKCVDDLATKPIPADIAQKLGVQPKER